MQQKNSTRFADFGFYRAILVISFLIALLIYGLMTYRPFLPDTLITKPNHGDLLLYKRIVAKIHNGSGYYTVAGDEMRRMDYPTRSVFNWRLPTLAWLLGQLPSARTGRLLAAVTTSLMLLSWMIVFQQKQYASWQVLLGGLILSGPVVFSIVTDAYLSHEFWAGTLIALSLAANARGWHVAAVVSGLIALLLRELSLPFVCVMIALSYMEGRRQEALAWFMGILVFCSLFLLHWSIVSKLIAVNDRAMPDGWVVFSGWPFVLHTAQMYPHLMLTPSWITAIVLPLGLLGLAGWRGASGLRVACTVGIYVLAFLIVGRTLNKYWGLMYAFVMPLGLLHTPAALRDLWQPISEKLK